MKKTFEQTGADQCFGNKDLEKKYPFPSNWMDSVVVRTSQSVRIERIDNEPGEVIEVPSSVRIRPYDPSLFDTHVETGMFSKENILMHLDEQVPKGKFEKINVEILHDPRPGIQKNINN